MHSAWLRLRKKKVNIYIKSVYVSGRQVEETRNRVNVHGRKKNEKYATNSMAKIRKKKSEQKSKHKSGTI